jgi:hypothetical protein
MNRLLLSIMIFASSLIFGVAEGADWTLITKGQSDDIDVFVDQESVKRISDNVVRAWIKYKYSNPRHFDSKYIKELVVYNEYYCTERKYKILQSEGYFTNGTRETDSSERQGYILPDDAAHKYLCK